MKPLTKTRRMPRARPDATRSRAAKRDTEALARAREAAAERRRSRDDALLAEYREWLRLESAAYATYHRLGAMFGPNHPETRAAHDEWRAAMSLIPQLPPDSAFRRERGDER